MADCLVLQGVVAGYGAARVLHDINLRLGEGQSLALLGRNGMGKTTLVDTIVGATRLFAGSISLFGRDITREPGERRAALGIGWVPQERNVFRSLTVEENLTAVARPGPWTVERAYDLFPRLRERRRNLGRHLSGGEQQMLAFARALVLNPRLVLLDEPLEGLAPVTAAELLAVLRRLVREEGTSFVIVEQHALKILGFVDRAIVLERGRIAHDGPSDELLAEPGRLEALLAVAAAPGG